MATFSQATERYANDLSDLGIDFSLVYYAQSDVTYVAVLTEDQDMDEAIHKLQVAGYIVDTERRVYNLYFNPTDRVEKRIDGIFDDTRL